MKILLLNQAFYPDNVATAQQVFDLANFLVEAGHEVSVICDRRGYEERGKTYPSEETWKGISVHRVSTTGLGKQRLRYRLVDSITFFTGLVWKLVRFSPQDLVISFTSPPLIGFFGALFCLFKGGESIQWLMDINPDAAFKVGYLRRKSLVGRVLNRVLEFTLQRAKYVVVLDQWMKKTAVEHGVPEASVVVVPPWSVFKESDPHLREAIAKFKKDHQLENKFIVLYSGNHSLVHPLDTVLESAKALRDNPEILFLFIGAGLRARDVTLFKEKHGLTNIKQLPLQPREQVKASFGSADVHCVVMGPGMSGVVHVSKIYSVLASGKPFVFVGAEQSHIGDLVSEEQLGQVVNNESSAQFIEAIHRVQKLTPKELETIQEKSRHVVREFSPERSLRKFYEAAIESDEKDSVTLSYEVSIP